MHTYPTSDLNNINVCRIIRFDFRNTPLPPRDRYLSLICMWSYWEPSRAWAINSNTADTVIMSNIDFNRSLPPNP